MTDSKRVRVGAAAYRRAQQVHAVGYKERVSVPRCPGAHRWWCPVEDCPTEHVPKPETATDDARNSR